MTYNATLVGCVPVGGEWSKSYKASGYERSSQKTHNFAKNVTLFTFPNSCFFFSPRGRNLTLVNNSRSFQSCQV